MPKINQNIKRILALVLLAALFFFVDINKFVALFSSLSLGMIAFLLFISFVLVYVSAMKWGVFLRGLGIKVSIFKLNALYLLGYFVNLLLPSFVGGDVVRSLSIGKDVAKHDALAATVLERYTGLLALVGMGVIFIWFAPLVTFEVQAIIICIAIGLGFITLVCLSPKIFSKLEKISGIQDALKPLAKIQQAVRFGLSKRAILLETMSLSIIFYVLAVINTIACAYAVGWTTVPWKELFVVLPIVLLIGALPISPSGLGVQEGAFFYFLQGIGATPEQALGVALVLRAKVYILAICGWLVWVLGIVGRPELKMKNEERGEPRSAFEGE